MAWACASTAGISTLATRTISISNEWSRPQLSLPQTTGSIHGVTYHNRKAMAGARSELISSTNYRSFSMTTRRRQTRPNARNRIAGKLLKMTKPRLPRPLGANHFRKRAAWQNWAGNEDRLLAAWSNASPCPATSTPSFPLRVLVSGS